MLSLRNSGLCAVLLLLSPPIIRAGDENEAANAPYRASTSEVRLTFFTTDERNHPVDVVSKDDFAVIDDDIVVREFRALTRSEETALDVVILVDTSESVTGRLNSVKRDVLSLIAQSSGAGRISVVSFSGLQETLLCSGDCGSTDATRRLLGMQTSGATPLYDALKYSAEFIANLHMPGARPVVLLFSDGDDTISRTSARDALQAVTAAGALLYTVDLNVISTTERDGNRNDSPGSVTLRQMAEATGGRYFSTGEDAMNALQTALEDLRASYVVTYALPRRTIGFHALRILPRHNPALQFHCHSGYYYWTSVP